MRRAIAARAVLAAMALSALTASAQSTVPQAADLARQLQQRYATIRDFTAEFTHTYRSGLLPQTTVERGRVRVKKPGRMRWMYEAPEKKEIVADGSQVYAYIPADRNVTITPMPKGDDVPTAMLFLTGQGDLLRDFRPSLPSNQVAGEWRLELAPRTRQPDFDSLSLLVDRLTLKLVGLVTIDAQGGTGTLRFTHLVENAGLADREFVFDISKLPRGVDIIR